MSEEDVVGKTIRKLTNEIYELEHRINAIAHSLTDAFVSFDSKGKIVFWNEGALNIFGYEDHEILNQSIIRLVPERYRSDFLKRLDEVKASSTSTLEKRIYEIIAQKKDGSEFPAEISYMRWIKEGELFITCIFRDIFERKKAEIALHKEKHKYQMLVTNIMEGVVLIDKEGYISYINPKAAQIIGHSEEKILGKPGIYIIPDEILSIIPKKVERQAFDIIERYELWFKSFEGLDTPAMVSTIRLFSETKEYQGILAVITDMTRVKKIQEFYQRFFGVVSHELRTPVTVLKAYIDFLRLHSDLPQEEVRKIYFKLNSNVYRLLRLLSNIQDFSKIIHEVFRISVKPTNLEEFSITIKEQCHILFPNRCIMINYIAHRSVEEVTIDQDYILQAIHNLVNNSVKQSPKDSIIEIIIEVSHMLYISVLDQGIGIPIENFFKLFLPFSHFDSEYTTRGTGLGLYIVRNIVFSHGGMIEVSSREHFGSCFTLIIPPGDFSNDNITLH